MNIFEPKNFASCHTSQLVHPLCRQILKTSGISLSFAMCVICIKKFPNRKPLTTIPWLWIMMFWFAFLPKMNLLRLIFVNLDWGGSPLSQLQRHESRRFHIRESNKIRIGQNNERNNRTNSKTNQSPRKSALDYHLILLDNIFLELFGFCLESFNNPSWFEATRRQHGRRWS